MKRVLSFLLVSGLLLLGTGIATYADLAKPKASPSNTVALPANQLAWSNLTIEPDPKTNRARLQISQTTLNNLRAALTDQPGTQSIAQTIATSSPHTIVAGLSLFLAISLGGIWLMRSPSSRSQKAMAAALIGAAVFSVAAMIARANEPAPFYRWRPLVQNLRQGKTTSGIVEVEIVAEGEGMKLILPVAATRGNE